MKQDKNNTDAKKRILETAARLFAEKGYGSVGVREIAAEAGVNISMISYYFNGKIGLLKSIISDHFQEIQNVLIKSIDGEMDRESKLRNVVKSMVGLIREHPHRSRIAFIEFPLDVPELLEYKKELMRENRKFIKEIFHGKNPQCDKDVFEHANIIGPAFISLIYSHFLTHRHKFDDTQTKYDEAYFDNYCETISDLFLGGIKSVVDKTMINNGGKCLECHKKMKTIN